MNVGEKTMIAGCLTLGAGKLVNRRLQFSIYAKGAKLWLRLNAAPCIYSLTIEMRRHFRILRHHLATRSEYGECGKTAIGSRNYRQERLTMTVVRVAFLSQGCFD